MELASVDDVKRILRLTDDNVERDAQIRASLEAVESLLSDRLQIPSEGPQVDAHYDIPEDATLYLPSPDVVVTKVKVFEYPSISGLPLSPIDLGLGRGYEVTDGRLILRPVFGVQPFEGAVAQRLLRVYARVEVFYQGSGVVPTAVTEGVAYLAAGYWKSSPQVLAGLKGEKIGDYSYTNDNSIDPLAGEPVYWSMAMKFLRRYMNRQRVRVI